MYYYSIKWLPKYFWYSHVQIFWNKINTIDDIIYYLIKPTSVPKLNLQNSHACSYLDNSNNANVSKDDINQNKIILINIILNPSRPDPGRREKINLKFLFWHFFVVPQKVLWRSYFNITFKNGKRWEALMTLALLELSR